MTPDQFQRLIAMGAQPQSHVHQPQPTTQQPKQSQVKPMKSAKYSQPIGAKLLAPVEWFAKSASWLTNCGPRGGARFVFFGLSGACLLLSVETVYTAMPPSPAVINQGIGNRHFLPKPAINDDANVSLINPLPVISTGAKVVANYTLGFLPFYPRHTINPRWTVWADPAFYLAATIALAIQATEAIAWRRMSKRWEDKMAKFQQLNSRSVPNLNPNAVIAARVAQAELATEGTGGYIGTAFVILAVYGVEFFTFTRSVADVTVPGFTIFVYGLVNIFGFELCLALAQNPDDEK